MTLSKLKLLSEMVWK